MNSAGAWWGAWHAPKARYMKKGLSGSEVRRSSIMDMDRSTRSVERWRSVRSTGGIGVLSITRSGDHWLVSGPRNP